MRVAVILLDELEKAHKVRQMLNAFLNILMFP
jgi:ATP-dependent Clp protease ATP-binding subunit ClpA